MLIVKFQENIDNECFRDYFFYFKESLLPLYIGDSFYLSFETIYSIAKDIAKGNKDEIVHCEFRDSTVGWIDYSYRLGLLQQGGI